MSISDILVRIHPLTLIVDDKYICSYRTDTTDFLLYDIKTKKYSSMQGDDIDEKFPRESFKLCHVYDNYAFLYGYKDNFPNYSKRIIVYNIKKFFAILLTIKIKKNVLTVIDHFSNDMKNVDEVREIQVDFTFGDEDKRQPELDSNYIDKTVNFILSILKLTKKLTINDIVYKLKVKGDSIHDFIYESEEGKEYTEYLFINFLENEIKFELRLCYKSKFHFLYGFNEDDYNVYKISCGKDAKIYLTNDRNVYKQTLLNFIKGSEDSLTQLSLLKKILTSMSFCLIINKIKYLFHDGYFFNMTARSAGMTEAEIDKVLNSHIADGLEVEFTIFNTTFTYGFIKETKAIKVSTLQKLYNIVLFYDPNVSVSTKLKFYDSIKKYVPKRDSKFFISDFSPENENIGNIVLTLLLNVKFLTINHDDYILENEDTKEVKNLRTNTSLPPEEFTKHMGENVKLFFNHKSKASYLYGYSKEDVKKFKDDYKLYSISKSIFVIKSLSKYYKTVLALGIKTFKLTPEVVRKLMNDRNKFVEEKDDNRQVKLFLNLIDNIKLGKLTFYPNNIRRNLETGLYSFGEEKDKSRDYIKKKLNKMKEKGIIMTYSKENEKYLYDNTETLQQRNISDDSLLIPTLEEFYNLVRGKEKGYKKEQDVIQDEGTLWKKRSEEAKDFIDKRIERLKKKGDIESVQKLEKYKNKMDERTEKLLRKYKTKTMGVKELFIGKKERCDLALFKKLWKTEPLYASLIYSACVNYDRNMIESKDKLNTFLSRIKKFARFRKFDENTPLFIQIYSELKTGGFLKDVIFIYKDVGYNFIEDLLYNGGFCNCDCGTTLLFILYKLFPDPNYVFFKVKISEHTYAVIKTKKQER